MRAHQKRLWENGSIVAVCYVLITKLAYSKDELEEFKKKAEDNKAKEDEGQEGRQADVPVPPAVPAPA